MENRARGQDWLALEGRNHTTAVWKRKRCGSACGADFSVVDSGTSGVDLATKGERETRHNSRRGAQDTDVAQLRHRTGRE